jgi:hypothetical protein
MMKLKHYSLALLSVTLFSCGNSSSSPDAGTGEKDHKDAPTASAKPKAPAAEGARRVLFIGNSHTDYYVSLPKMFSEVCTFNKQDMKVDELVEMGISLKEIYNQDKTKADAMFANKDNDGNYYDYVVIQEKTPVALQGLEEYKTSVKMLADKVHANSPGAVILVYEVMSPVDYQESASDFKDYYKEMHNNAKAVVSNTPNATLYQLGSAVRDAYTGAHGYEYNTGGKDKLRYGQQTLHMLNDAGYLATALLYTTVFDQKPAMPETLTLSAGTGDSDGQKSMPVSGNISNAQALLDIAADNK